MALKQFAYVGNSLAASFTWLRFVVTVRGNTAVSWQGQSPAQRKEDKTLRIAISVVHNCCHNGSGIKLGVIHGNMWHGIEISRALLRKAGCLRLKTEFCMEELVLQPPLCVCVCVCDVIS